MIEQIIHDANKELTDSVNYHWRDTETGMELLSSRGVHISVYEYDVQWKGKLYRPQFCIKYEDYDKNGQKLDFDYASPNPDFSIIAYRVVNYRSANTPLFEKDFSDGYPNLLKIFAEGPYGPYGEKGTPTKHIMQIGTQELVHLYRLEAMRD